MPSVDDLSFEMERRIILLHRDTTMPDKTKLNYVGNPNNAINGNTQGETLLHYSPSGTNYLDKGVSPAISWIKIQDPPGGSWVINDPGAEGVSGDNIEIEKFTLDSTDITNGYVTIGFPPKAQELKLEVKGAPSQYYGVDFKQSEVVSTRIEWANLDLESVLQVGDQLTITYVQL